MRSKGAPTMPHARKLLAVGLSLALAAACHQDELFTPLVPAYTGGALFQRYVSMGNSIAMGIQSGGIDDSSQRIAYPRSEERRVGKECVCRWSPVAEKSKCDD